MEALSKEHSIIINAVKSVLLLLVVYIHQLPNSYIPIGTELKWDTFYRLVSETISHNIGRIAVPGFFVFSGFFFFHSIGDTLSLKWLKAQWGKRLRSTLIPYLLWNLFLLLVIYFKNILNIGQSSDDFLDLTEELGIFGIFWNYPLNIPLWYLRDLMCMFFISPLLFIICKRYDWPAILVLFFMYCFNLETNIPGFSSVAIIYFTIGSYFAIKRIDIISFVNRYRISIYITALVSLILSICLNGSGYHEYLVRLFIPSGFAATINAVSSMREPVIDKLSKCATALLFVYFIHWIYVRNIVNGFFSRLCGSSVFGAFMSYLFAPITIIVICWIIYFLWKKISPQSLKFCLGNRV